MPSSPSDRLAGWAWAALVVGTLFLLSGCIADTAEDSDLPWARNQGWEGMIPLPYGVGGQND